MINRPIQPSSLAGFVDFFTLFIYFGFLIFIVSVTKWGRKKDE